MPAETVRTVLAKAETWFADKSLDSPRHSPQMLLARALGPDPLPMLSEADRPLAPAELDAFRALARRRAAGEPVAYILGEKEFYGLTFAVDASVLVPRPETEGIVDAVREALAPEDAFSFADLGTGSGCLAVTLAVQFPSAQGLAVDISAKALAVARQNAARHGVDGRLRFVEADFARLPAEDGSFALIVANPPYVSEPEYAELSPEVADFEPRGALVSGPDGLDAVRGLLPEALRALAPGGLLLMEIGSGQGTAAADLARETGFDAVGVLRDLAGHARTIMARKN